MPRWGSPARTFRPVVERLWALGGERREAFQRCRLHGDHGDSHRVMFLGNLLQATKGKIVCFSPVWLKRKIFEAGCDDPCLYGLRQEDWTLNATLSYVESLRPAWTISDLVDDDDDDDVMMMMMVLNAQKREMRER